MQSKFFNVTISLLSMLLTHFLIQISLKPALNISAPGTWLYIIVVLLVGTWVSLSLSYLNDDDFFSFNLYIITGFLLIGAILILLIGRIESSVVFQSKKAYQRLEVTTDSFENSVQEFDMKAIPRIDQEVAKSLANKKLGELESVVSQFDTDDYATLINYQGNPYRVIPLEYANPLKYLTNKESGIPGYVLVDLIKQTAEYVELEEGIKYTPSAYFSYDLNKHIKSKYPSCVLGEFNFEIDEEGTPYWVVPVIHYHEFLGGVKTNESTIVVNAINGKIKKYNIDDIPSWIDHALETDLIIEQIDSWGKYKNGFWNSTFFTSQKGVKESTNLHNFIIQNDDIYLYTGITSVNADKSNIGFMLVNMRTGQTKYITCPSITETAAQDTAKAIYPEREYEVTDPLLLNVNNVPTYVASLKAEDKLVKVYAFINATDPTIIGYASGTEGMEKALENYTLALEGKTFLPTDSTNSNNNSNTTPEVSVETAEITLQISQAKEIVFNGTTSLYIIDKDGKIYIAPITANAEKFFTLKTGDELTASTYQKDGYFFITKFE